MVVFSFILTLAGGCANTYKIKSASPVVFGVHSMDVPSFLKTKVLYTRINDFILREMPKSKIDTSGTVGGIASKKLIDICENASKCRIVFPEGLPTNTSMVKEGHLFKGAAFETDLGYLWMSYLLPVSKEKILSDIKLTQNNYKPASKASIGSFRTRYGAVDQTREMKYWQTMVEGENSSGSQKITIYYASESLDSDKNRIDLKVGSFVYMLLGRYAEYERKRTVDGLEGMEWMVERGRKTRYYEWSYVGEVSDIGKTRFTITLEGPLSMDEEWHETIWNFILNSVRLCVANQE